MSIQSLYYEPSGVELDDDVYELASPYRIGFDPADSLGGYADGYSAGYAAGEAAHASDYSDGYAAGEAAHANDYSNGYTAGYTAGYAAGAASVPLVYRMRAKDTTLGEIVYWNSIGSIDGTGAEYTGPGPLIDIVVQAVVGS